MPLGSKFAWGRVKIPSLSDADSADQVFDWGEAHAAGDAFRVYRFQLDGQLTAGICRRTR